MKKEMYKSMYETENYHWYFRSKRDIVLSLLGKYLGKGKDIIDLGCGCGLMLSKLEKYGTVSGVDFSEEAIEYCRSEFNGELICGNLETLQLPKKYDCAVMLDVLEHIQNQKKVLQNIYHVLNKEGKIVITVPADMRLWSQHDENCMHYRRYSRENLENVLADSGYRILYISYYNSRLYPVVLLVRKVEKLFNIKNKGSRIEYGFKPGLINDILYRIFSGEKRRLLAGKTYKKGVSLICVAQRME